MSATPKAEPAWLASLRNAVGTEIGITDWFSLDQEQVDQFSELIDDWDYTHQFDQLPPNWQYETLEANLGVGMMPDLAAAESCVHFADRSHGPRLQVDQDNRGPTFITMEEMSSAAESYKVTVCLTVFS